MKHKTIGLNYKGKKILMNVLECNMFEMGRGLMFRGKKNARALLFDLKKPVRKAIHSFFVFFPFIAVWLDDKDKVIEIKLVKWFKPYIVPKRPWKKLIEVPVNKKYCREIALLRRGQKHLNMDLTLREESSQDI